MRAFISQRLALPLFDMAKGLSVSRAFEEMRSLARLSREDVVLYQNQKLQSLLQHAYTKTPYYREVFDQRKLRPEDIHTVHDLTLLPELRRVTLQTREKDMLSLITNRKRCYTGSSSGSTGQPVRYLRDRGGSSWGQGAAYFGWSLSNWTLGSPLLTIWGNPTTVQRDWTKLSSRLKSWLFNEIKVPAFALRDGCSMEKLADLVSSGSFAFIQGYTNAIYALAMHCQKSGRLIHKVRGVLTTAETLHQTQRKLIEDVLGPVFDCYGCGEINAVAYQCGQEGAYHIMDPHVVVEFGAVVDDLGNREILITDLDNRAMPLIRYANGDKGLQGKQPCSCGLPFSTMVAVSGRTGDVVRTPEGGVLAVPSFFGSRLLKEVDGIERYQVEALPGFRLRINLEVNHRFSVGNRILLENALKDYLPSSMAFEVALVNSIPLASNGKFKLVVDRTMEEA